MSMDDTDRPGIFSLEGQAALARLMAVTALLAFDLDGTLAPIVDHPEDVRVAPDVAASLAALGRWRPIAIITGRAVADARGRLGFTPQHIIGNHGAESEFSGLADSWCTALNGFRDHLAREAYRLRRAGVTVEDKRQSIALHYRLAPDIQVARQAIHLFLQAAAEPRLRFFGGKRVYNVVAAGAPDKGDALLQLVAHLHSPAALFVGDDINDEAVFSSAPPHWLTVKVGRGGRPSQAQYLLQSHEGMLPLLRRLLWLVEA